MTSHAARRAAAAVARQAPRKAKADPIARGADWRTATVASISAGTITTTTGIPCRRMESYRAPAVGDVCVITQSGNGNWVATGRLANTTDGWTALPLASGWTAYGAPYWTPSYRLNGDGTASLCGMAKPTGTVTGTVTVGTLPAAAAPANQCRFVSEAAGGVYAFLDILTSGVVRIGDYSGNAAFAALDVARQYRLT